MVLSWESTCFGALFGQTTQMSCKKHAMLSSQKSAGPHILTSELCSAGHAGEISFNRIPCQATQMFESVICTEEQDVRQNAVMSSLGYSESWWCLRWCPLNPRGESAPFLPQHGLGSAKGLPTISMEQPHPLVYVVQRFSLCVLESSSWCYRPCLRHSPWANSLVLQLHLAKKLPWLGPQQLANDAGVGPSP